MPVVTQAYYTRPEEMVDHFFNDIQQNAEVLGLAFVGTYDEKLIPAYPAVVISAGPVEKELHGTATYLVKLRTFFYVMHAQLTLDHRMRNQEDLELATRISEFIERDMTLGGKVIHHWVESEVPGVLSPRTTKGDAVVGTRLHNSALSGRRFK
jgi:hypothetical protein